MVSNIIYCRMTWHLLNSEAGRVNHYFSSEVSSESPQKTWEPLVSFLEKWIKPSAAISLKPQVFNFNLPKNLPKQSTAHQPAFWYLAGRCSNAKARNCCWWKSTHLVRINEKIPLTMAASMKTLPSMRTKQGVCTLRTTAWVFSPSKHLPFNSERIFSNRSYQKRGMLQQNKANIWPTMFPADFLGIHHHLFSHFKLSLLNQILPIVTGLHHKSPQNTQASSFPLAISGLSDGWKDCSAVDPNGITAGDLFGQSAEVQVAKEDSTLNGILHVEA